MAPPYPLPEWEGEFGKLGSDTASGCGLVAQVFEGCLTPTSPNFLIQWLRNWAADKGDTPRFGRRDP